MFDALVESGVIEDYITPRIEADAHDKMMSEVYDMPLVAAESRLLYGEPSGELEDESKWDELDDDLPF